MGLRYLFLGLAVWGVYLIVRHLIRQPKPQQPIARQSKSVDSVQCAYCGLHLPREEALREGDAYYCSKSHLQASDRQHES
jgi:uncharacterized protein